MFQQKQVLLISFVLILLLGIHGCQKGTESPISLGKRPNLLFIMSDDHAYQAISAYSDKLIQTPNIDRIAKEGMLFSNAMLHCSARHQRINYRSLTNAPRFENWASIKSIGTEDQSKID